jgi:putative membrane protein
LSAGLILGTAAIFPAIHVDVFATALILVLVLGLLNMLLKPLLIVLTIPITILTFGLFLLVINAVMVLVGDILVGGFSVDNFWWAMLFSLIISFGNSIIDRMLGRS